QAPLTVTTGGTGTPLTLSAAGQSTAFLTAPDPNVALTMQAGDQYLIAVVNTDPTAASRSDFMLLGSGGTALASGATAAGAAARTSSGRSTPASAERTMAAELPPALAAMGDAARRHLEVLEDNRQIFASLGNPRRARANAAAARASGASEANAAR